MNSLNDLVRWKHESVQVVTQSITAIRGHQHNANTNDTGGLNGHNENHVEVSHTHIIAQNITQM